MKRFGLILVLICLLAGAAGAGWWFFLRAPDAEDAPGATAAQGAGETGDLLMKTTFELTPISLPILRNGRVIEHRTLVLTIEFTAPRRLDDLQRLRPRLRHAVLSELHGMYALRHVQEHGHELPIVRLRIQRASESVLGEGSVKAVYFKSMSRRPLETS